MVPAVVHDGVKAMSNCKDSAVIELRADGGLYQVVRFHVHSCCGLI